jgi:integrase/recombinase XerD
METVKPFRDYLGRLGILDVTAVTRETLKDYQSEIFERLNLKGKPLAVGTRNAFIRGVKQLYGFLVWEGYMAGDPSRVLVYTKEPKTLPRSILSEEDVRKILKVPDTSSVTGYRDKAILEVLYSTGLRNQEIRFLKVTDVDWEEGFVRVEKGKGGKGRMVPMGKVACRWVENYVKGIRPLLVKKDPESPWLFLPVRGGQMSREALSEVVVRLAKRAGLNKWVTPHTFRHTCATQMLKNRASLRHVQEMLGHASVQTTQIYTAVSAADLKEAHQKYHPRERGNTL